MALHNLIILCLDFLIFETARVIAPPVDCNRHVGREQRYPYKAPRTDTTWPFSVHSGGGVDFHGSSSKPRLSLTHSDMANPRPTLLASVSETSLSPSSQSCSACCALLPMFLS